MRKKMTILFFAFVLSVASATAQTQQATVKITGEVTTPLTVDAAALHQYSQINVIRKDKDGIEHTYTGVALSDLLTKAGVTMGAQLKGDNLTKLIIVDASDGYEVIFALAELDKSFTDRSIILADIVDGKPLAAGDGPFRIIVQEEKKPARCIKQVTVVKVVFAK